MRKRISTEHTHARNDRVYYSCIQFCINSSICFIHCRAPTYVAVRFECRDLTAIRLIFPTKWNFYCWRAPKASYASILRFSQWMSHEQPICRHKLRFRYAFMCLLLPFLALCECMRDAHHSISSRNRFEFLKDCHQRSRQYWNAANSKDTFCRRFNACSMDVCFRIRGIRSHTHTRTSMGQTNRAMRSHWFSAPAHAKDKYLIVKLATTWHHYFWILLTTTICTSSSSAHAEASCQQQNS